MFKKIIYVVILTLLVIGCSKKAKLETDYDFTDPKPNIFPKFAFEYLQDIIGNENIISIQKINKNFNMLTTLTPITYRMIKSSGNEVKRLENEANLIVQKEGYKHLEDFGDHLKELTWSGGTYLKMCKFDKTIGIDPTLPINRFLEENLRRRFEKLKLSKADLKLIKSNWKRFESAMHTLDELAEAHVKFAQQK